jgi:glycosyltransferase involved in cell wall biosynthesis
MKIEVYTLANNEERLMPYIIRHYNRFAKVIILENNSTDQTIEIAHSLGAEIWSYKIPDELNDQIHVDIKNNCWKNSKADWVIICDADEFVYHRDIIDYLSNTKATIFCPRLFNMYSEQFPTTGGQIYDEVNRGVEGGGKINLWRPSEISEINFAVGCHNARPAGNVIFGIDSRRQQGLFQSGPKTPVNQILTLHMRYLSRQYLIERSARAGQRLSALNRKNGWGYHMNFTPERIGVDYDNEIKKAIRVI